GTSTCPAAGGLLARVVVGGRSVGTASGAARHPRQRHSSSLSPCSAHTRDLFLRLVRAQVTSRSVSRLSSTTSSLSSRPALCSSEASVAPAPGIITSSGLPSPQKTTPSTVGIPPSLRLRPFPASTGAAACPTSRRRL